MVLGVPRSALLSGCDAPAHAGSRKEQRPHWPASRCFLVPCVLALPVVLFCEDGEPVSVGEEGGARPPGVTLKESVGPALLPVTP